MRWKLAAICLLTGAVVTSLAEAASPRPIRAEEFEQLLRVAKSHPPERITVTIYSVEKRLKKPSATIEADVRKMIDQLEKDGVTPPGVKKEDLIRMNIEARVRMQEQPHVTRERFTVDTKASRRDWVDSHDQVEVTAETPFHHTYITPGEPAEGDGRFYVYAHHLKSATRNTYNTSRQVSPTWKRMFGYWQDLNNILLMSVIETPKVDPKNPPPKTRIQDAPMSGAKIKSIIDGTGDMKILVTELGQVGDTRRVQIDLFLVQPEFRMASLVLDADNFANAYEQTMYTPQGEPMIQVAANGFREGGIPSEIKWIKKRPEGQEVTESAVLDVSYDRIDPAQFEFAPPEEYAVAEIGPDGRGNVNPAAAVKAPEVAAAPRSWMLLVIVNAVLIFGILGFVMMRRARKDQT